MLLGILYIIVLANYVGVSIILSLATMMLMKQEVIDGNEKDSKTDAFLNILTSLLFTSLFIFMTIKGFSDLHLYF